VSKCERKFRTITVAAVWTAICINTQGCQSLALSFVEGLFGAGFDEHVFDIFGGAIRNAIEETEENQGVV
jgi:hypothetical protein